MHGPKCMMESGMNRTRVNQVAYAELSNPAHSLEISVLNNIEDQLVWYGNEPVYRVIDYFLFVHAK